MSFKKKPFRWGLALFVLLPAIFSYQGVAAQTKKPMVRIARIVVDSARLEAYKAALKEEIETAVRVEPGVLSLYAVYEVEHPTHVTVFEIYADEGAYKAHMETAHFLKYKTATKDMVKSLELRDVSPIAMEAKARQ